MKKRSVLSCVETFFVWNSRHSVRMACLITFFLSALPRCSTSVSPAGGGQALQCSNRNYSTHINDIDLTSCGLPDVTYPHQAQEAQKGHKDVVRVQQQQEPTCCQPQQAPCKSVSINSGAFNNFVLFQPYWSELVDF